MGWRRSEIHGASWFEFLGRILVRTPRFSPSPLPPYNVTSSDFTEPVNRATVTE